MSSGTSTQTTEYPKLVTEDQVKAALIADKGSRANLLSWSTDDFTKKGDNFASIITGVKISYRCKGEKDQSTSYVFKVKPRQVPDGYQTLLDAQSVKEVGFYEDILPALNAELAGIGEKPLRFPRMIYSSGEGNSKDLLILEDLRPIGFRMASAKKGLDVPQALLVLQELARLHAASYLLQEKIDEDLALKFKFLKLDFHNHSEKAEYLCGNVFSENFGDVYRVLKKIEGYKVVKQWLTNHMDKTVDIFKQQLAASGSYDLLCHGDCWTNNLLFRYDDGGSPSEVAFLDVQLCRKASIATDLNNFMYTSLVGNVRKTNLDILLASYYSVFSRVVKGSGKDMPFSSQGLLQEYRHKQAFGLIFGMFSTMLILRPSDEVPDFIAARGEEDDKQVGISERSLEAMAKDPLFWPRLLSIFDEMLEHGIITS